MIDKWEKRFKRVRFFSWLFLAGLPFFCLTYFTTEFFQNFCLIASCVLFVPAACYLYVVVIWHWKDRYRGKHPDLWGTIILIETSGGMKVIYFFRHILPDMCHSGRYRPDPQPILPD